MMKVVLKEPYEAQQFNPRYGIPSCVVDLLRAGDYPRLRSKGYEWGVIMPDNTTVGVHIGDWIITSGDNIFLYSNAEFKNNFKQVIEED